MRNMLLRPFNTGFWIGSGFCEGKGSLKGEEAKGLLEI